MIVYKSTFFYLRRKWNKVVGTGSRLRAGRFEVRIPQEEEIFLFSKICRPSLDPTPLPTQDTGVLSRE
jgi:hypothetical protein